MKAMWKIFTILPALMGCAGKMSSVTGLCSATKSVLNAQNTGSTSFSNANAGLLLSVHYDSPSATWDSGRSLSKCNTYLEMLDADSGKIRLWTAAHCLRPLLLTSLQLAMRNEASSIGGFHVWDLEHPILTKGREMRTAYSELSPNSYVGTREKLAAAFDRSQMWVNDQTSVLAPRTSCENLRWLTPADGLHALCFSVHDLMHLDVTLPEPDSAKSQALMTALRRESKSTSTQAALEEKRSVFMRRINLLSQVEWITSQEQNLTGYMNNPQGEFPSTEIIAAVVARLQKRVFDTPHPEESAFMSPTTVTTQDKAPGQNETLSVLKSGTYYSPRLPLPLLNVHVACVRSLRKMDANGNVVTLSELEYRPHAYCPGGSQPQAGHVWYRDYQWSRVAADLAHGGAKDYADAISRQLVVQGQLVDWAGRLSVVSNFSVDDEIDFFNEESDLVSPFLRALKVPASLFSTQLFGWQSFSDTGAFLLALGKQSVKARFLKGDSGALLLLDGVPIATLYSVDGEETSGGASIRALPTADAEEGLVPSSNAGEASGTRTTADNSATSGGKGGVGCLR